MSQFELLALGALITLVILCIPVAIRKLTEWWRKKQKRRKPRELWPTPANYRSDAGPFYAAQEWINAGGGAVLLTTWCIYVPTGEHSAHIVEDGLLRRHAIEFTDRLNQAVQYWTDSRKEER